VKDLLSPLPHYLTVAVIYYHISTRYIQQEPIKSKYEIGDVDELLDRHWFSVMKGWREVCFNEIGKNSNK